MSNQDRFEVYRDHTGEYRWRFLARNGRIIAAASEGYRNKGDCLAGLELVLSAVMQAGIAVIIEGAMVSDNQPSETPS